MSVSGGRRLSGKTAYHLVLFQVVPGGLHIDVFTGRKLRADPIIRCGTGFDVLAGPRFKSLFQSTHFKQSMVSPAALPIDARAVAEVLRVQPVAEGAQCAQQAGVEARGGRPVAVVPGAAAEAALALPQVQARALLFLLAGPVVPAPMR